MLPSVQLHIDSRLTVTLLVVRTCEEAAQARDGPFDYIVLCVKALPEIYDLSSVIESVVTPQHTCILVNSTNSIGVEAALEERFPTNVVLSMVSWAELSQLGPSEFEHKGSTEVWVGPAGTGSSIPSSIQEDMAQALAITLSTGQVECKVSRNIRQQQFERVIGFVTSLITHQLMLINTPPRPIAFQPLSIIFETPNHTALLEKVGVKDLISDILDELVQLGEKCGCKFNVDFKQHVMDENTRTNAPESTMWQDYVSRRPLEIETYLGAPIKLAKDLGVPLPRIETLYTILHHTNTTNRQRPKAVDANGVMPPGSPTGSSPLPKMPPPGGHRPTMSGMPMPNGNGMPPRQPRPRNSSNFSQSGGMRRPPPPMQNGGPPNGYHRPPSQMNGGGSRVPSRRGSMDGNDLEEFSHLVLYDDIPEGSEASLAGDPSDISMREREMNHRQREMALREQDMRVRRGPPSQYGGGGPRRGPHPMRNSQQVFDDDDDDDYLDAPMGSGASMIDPDNFDMMSVTSRKNRKMPTPGRQMDGPPPPSRGGRFRPSMGRNRSSQLGALPMTNDNILDDPLMSCSSNRYGAVDRGSMGHPGSRANSLTAARLEEFQYGGPPPGMNGGFPRRVSQSPGHPYAGSMRGGNGRPSPPNGYGPPMNGRPSPPESVRQPVPRYPPGHGNAVAPHQVEQQVGVSSLRPPKPRNVRSLTGSASASAGSGELDSEPSAHSSQSSLQQRPSTVGVN